VEPGGSDAWPFHAPHVATVGPTQARKRLSGRRDDSLRIVFVARHEHADAPLAVALLRARRERPCRRAAESRDARRRRLICPSRANINKTNVLELLYYFFECTGECPKQKQDDGGPEVRGAGVSRAHRRSPGDSVGIGFSSGRPGR
jgi:hypothetical protein